MEFVTRFGTFVGYFFHDSTWDILFSYFRELILFYMVSTILISFHANIECRQMIHLNGNSTYYIIVKIFRPRQHWNMRKALHISPKAKSHSTVQIQRKIRDPGESPVARCGGLIWVQQITAWGRLDGVSKTVWIGLYYRHLSGNRGKSDLAIWRSSSWTRHSLNNSL